MPLFLVPRKMRPGKWRVGAGTEREGTFFKSTNRLRDGDSPKILHQVALLGLNTLETVYKVAICPRGNLLYKQIYFTYDQNPL